MKKMSNYIDEMNTLVRTKSELKEIIIESGQTPGEVFSYYPNMIRNAIAAGGASEEAVNSYISAYLSAYNFIDQDTLSSNSYLTQHQDLSSYATKSYVVDYVATYAPTPDLSSYVTKLELSACGYITTSDVDMSGYLPLTGGEVTGPLYVSYQETNNALYGFKSYSHIVAGDENKTGVAFLASKRYCTNGIGSYINMASFFVNSDGRAKFAHKSSGGGGGDDAFMCFNAYGFKIAYSGAAGTAASTEYDLIHSGNINNYISGSAVIDEDLIPKETGTYTLGTLNKMYAATYTAKISASNNGLWIDNGGAHKYYAGGSSFRPYTNNAFTLGTDTIRWDSTYSYNYYFGYNVSFNSASDYNLNISLNGSRRFYYDTQTFTGTGTNKNLGTTNTPFAYTYTSYLILNGTDIMDIIGDVETLLANI